MRSDHSGHLRSALTLAGLLVLAGCGRDSPTAPTPGLSGPVVLDGYLRDSTGKFTGTKVFSDADGVPVELVSGTRVVATTTTVKGRYRFSDVAPGSYVVRTGVTSDLFDETVPLTVRDAMIEVADTLWLHSRGDLLPSPNPFRSTIWITFNMQVPADASLRVLDAAGNTVRILLEGTFPQGLNGVRWSGADRLGVPVPAGFYWLALFEPQGTRVQLVIRE